MIFKPWPKILRLEKKLPPIFTEKIDGTNACVVISQECPDENSLYTKEGLSIWAQSRSRFITPQSDNFGFAAWVVENANELLKLGEGHHYGEWWGLGIQRGYGLNEKRFSLFNTLRWGEHNPNTPSCCHVVPRLPKHILSEQVAKEWFMARGWDSLAAPGYTKIEGLIQYEPSTETMFKIIWDK